MFFKKLIKFRFYFQFCIFFFLFVVGDMKAPSKPDLPSSDQVKQMF